MDPQDLAPPPTTPEDAEIFHYIGLGFFFVMLALAIIAQLVVIAGGVAMIKRSNYSLAMFTSIITVIPCMSPCCVIGIPFGIWSLIVLSNTEVRRAFG